VVTFVAAYGQFFMAADSGVDGPVRPVLTMTLTPLDGATRTQVVIDVDFQTSGIGKLFGLLARRGARKEVPRDAEHLKQRLERAGAAGPD
jgi:hypothetical protein